MAQRGKARLKRRGLSEEAMVFTMADDGRSIWRSRSQPIVTYLHGGVIYPFRLKGTQTQID